MAVEKVTAVETCQTDRIKNVRANGFQISGEFMRSPWSNGVGS